MNKLPVREKDICEGEKQTVNILRNFFHHHHATTCRVKLVNNEKHNELQVAIFFLLYNRCRVV